MNNQGIQDLEKTAWELKKSFLQTIEPYRTDLWRYCYHLTGSPWDAEDLVQETLLKAMASLGQLWQPLNTKNYLFRIATNTWINYQRKNKVFFTDQDLEVQEKMSEVTVYDVPELMEELVEKLNPRQVAIIILMEVFEYTARETANMLGTTEGAIKSALHRSRKRLRKQELLNAKKSNKSLNKYKQNNGAPNPLIQSFIDAFNRRDPEGIASLLSENAQWDGVHVGQEYGKHISVKYSIADDFKDPFIDAQQASFFELWGRSVIIITQRIGDQLKLNDIIYLEIEDNQIILRKHYYFCEDLLREAAIELQIPYQEEKSYKL